MTSQREHAPLGVERIYDLARAGCYDNNAFFRVVPNFVGETQGNLTFAVQFGLSSDPGLTQAWSKQRINDDPGICSPICLLFPFVPGIGLFCNFFPSLANRPVKLSNKRGVVSFAAAGRDTRTTQLFFNLKDNTGLDSQGTPPSSSLLDQEPIPYDCYLTLPDMTPSASPQVCFF